METTRSELSVLQGTPAVEVGYDWAHFVSRSGEDGRRWVEEYRCRPSAEAQAWTWQALQHLRKGQIEAGRDLLERVAALLRSGAGLPPSIVRVLERWYLAALAYLHYLGEDFDHAERCLNEAHAAVADAIERHPCLLPIADHCSDFRFQRIRIARNRRRWEEMQEHVETARAMLSNQAPYCVLKDGTAIFLADIQNYYLSIPSLEERERDFLRFILDDEYRLRQFERFVAHIYIPPGFLVPFAS